MGPAECGSFLGQVKSGTEFLDILPSLVLLSYGLFSYKIEIDMVFAPTDVSITSLGQPLSAGTEYSMECEAAGSRPDPVITWWLGDTFLGHNNQVASE